MSSPLALPGSPLEVVGLAQRVRALAPTPAGALLAFQRTEALPHAATDRPVDAVGVLTGHVCLYVPPTALVAAPRSGSGGGVVGERVPLCDAGGRPVGITITAPSLLPAGGGNPPAPLPALLEYSGGAYPQDTDWLALCRVGLPSEASVAGGFDIVTALDAAGIPPSAYATTSRLPLTLPVGTVPSDLGLYEWRYFRGAGFTRRLATAATAAVIAEPPPPDVLLHAPPRRSVATSGGGAAGGGSGSGAAPSGVVKPTWTPLCPAANVTALAATRDMVLATTVSGELWGLPFPAVLRGAGARPFSLVTPASPVVAPAAGPGAGGVPAAVAAAAAAAAPVPAPEAAPAAVAASPTGAPVPAPAAPVPAVDAAALKALVSRLFAQLTAGGGRAAGTCSNVYCAAHSGGGAMAPSPAAARALTLIHATPDPATLFCPPL